MILNYSLKPKTSGRQQTFCSFLRLGDSLNVEICPLSSPMTRMWCLLLKATCVSFVFFFCTTVCSHNASYLFTDMSNTWAWYINISRCLIISDINFKCKKIIPRKANSIFFWLEAVSTKIMWILYFYPQKSLWTNFSVDGDSCEYGWWKWCPGHISHWRVQIEHKHRLRPLI